MGTLHVVVGLGLVAQLGTAPAYQAPAYQAQVAPPPAATAPPAAVAPPGPGTPPYVLSAALAPPARSPLAGQPVALVDVISRQSDRTRQLQAVRAYWELSSAVAKYYLARQDFDYLARLEGFEAGAAAGQQPANTAALDGALAALEADAREAELVAIERQYALAPFLATQVVSALPLPADMPHVGPYRSYFEQLFAGRAAPEAARRGNETMPIRFKEVELRASAVAAASDVLNATEESYVAGRAGREQVVERLHELARQRRAFIDAVLAYNVDVAEYALTVARRGSSATELAGMLVPRMPAAAAVAAPVAAPATVPTTAPTAPAASGPAPAASPTTRRPPPGRRATYEEPLLGVPAAGGDPAVYEAEGGSDAAGGWQPRVEEPTPAEPMEPVDPNEFGPVEEAPADVGPPPEPPDAPVEAPQVDDGGDAVPPEPPPAGPQPSEAVPNFDSALHGAARRHWAARPIVQVAYQATAANAAALPLYNTLPTDNPRQRAQQLGVALATTGAAPAGGGVPLSLDECLQAISPRDREAMTSAYWAARGQATRYAIVARQIEQLDALQKPTLALGAGGAVAMLELHAARRAAEADLARAEAELVAAEYRLPMRQGQTGPTRSLPTTAPHGGRYAMRLESFPPNVQSSAPVVRLAAAMPRWHAAVVARAEAVVDADAQRAARVGDYLRAPGDLQPALDAVGQQADASLAFVDTLTAYNQAIGQYAAAVLPANLPANQYVATLVLQPAAVAGRL